MGLVIIFLLLGDQLIIIGLLREIAINTVETSFKRLNLGDFSDGGAHAYKCKYQQYSHKCQHHQVINKILLTYYKYYQMLRL